MFPEPWPEEIFGEPDRLDLWEKAWEEQPKRLCSKCTVCDTPQRVGNVYRLPEELVTLAPGEFSSETSWVYGKMVRLHCRECDRVTVQRATGSVTV